MQVVPHLAKPSLQVTTQAPDVHCAMPLAGTSQVCPQAPQLSLSRALSTQLVEQGA
jgi:hypothetical protein